MRFLRENWLTHLAHRNDREPSIMDMIDEACALSGRKGINISPGVDVDDADITVDDVVDVGIAVSDAMNMSKSDDIVNDSNDVTTNVAVPELSHPGKSPPMVVPRGRLVSSWTDYGLSKRLLRDG